MAPTILALDEGSRFYFLLVLIDSARYKFNMEHARRIQVRTQGFRPTPALRAHIERELRKPLARARRTVGDVVAFLSDVNGPRGGEDKQCQIRARLASAGEVCASAVAADAYEAITKAARRLGRAIQRAAA
jgi:ribosome-associated translation inhibitor RaiA